MLCYREDCSWSEVGRIMKKFYTVIVLSLLIAVPLAQGKAVTTSPLDFAQVTYVKALQSEQGSWCFTTQVQHNDQGWDHYADAWQVVDMEGNVLAERKLAHPHDNEQPFTRSLCEINIKTNVHKVMVRAKCNVHGWGGKTVTVNLLNDVGKDFKVQRSQ